MSAALQRGTIFVEDARVIGHEAFAGDQYILRLAAPTAAGLAVPGSFAHVRCDAAIPLRRPISIMRADAGEGWIELLYKPVGAGLGALAQRRPGETVSILAPIGNGYSPDPARPDVLAIGGGVGIPPVLFLAERLAASGSYVPFVLMGSEAPFPFALCRSRRDAPGIPADACDALEDLEQAGIASRLASMSGLPGCYRGYVTDLGRAWLATRSAADLKRTQLAACGPEPMLRAAARLAADFDLPCELALEEFMACGVGGCAGCTVLVETGDGPAMKRVCVDGPVFAAHQVYPRLFRPGTSSQS